MKRLLVFIPIFLFVFCFSIFAQSKTVSGKYIYIKPCKIQNFVSKLNELGKLGYKLKLVERNTEFKPPENPDFIEIVGIVELEEGNSFEYISFQSLTLPDFVEQASPKVDSGFYFSNRISYSIRKDPYENLPEPTAEKGTTKRDIEEIEKNIELIRRLLSQDPVDGSIFILERKNGQTGYIEFKLATAFPTTSIFGTNVVDLRKNNITLEKSISEIDTVDYKPVSFFLSSATFKTKVSRLPTILFQNNFQDHNVEKPIYKVFANNRTRTTLRKDVDKASHDGFRIVATTDTLLLSQKDDNKVSYYWVDPSSKDFLQKLSEISNKGGKFITSEMDYFTKRLIFEEFVTADGKRFEYKVLKVVQQLVLRGSINSTAEFNELVNQGYQPKSLFYNNGMNVLFEKQRN